MSKKSIQLICKSCGGVMEPQDNGEILRCPFCGSTVMLADSDAVAVEKIRQETEFKKWEREDSRIEDEKNELYKNSRSAKVTLALTIICGVLCVASFSMINSFGRIIVAVSFLLQTALFLLSYLTRKEIINLNKIIKFKIVKLPTLLMAAGLLFFIPVVIFINQ